ncbi:Hypothetical predicted protein [Scomber scombrus]|uniref:Secreted protein n=1 Tax=Scomber scombrus TaxID=13677 RepID=A0AAV1PG64_SCOSC
MYKYSCFSFFMTAWRHSIEGLPCVPCANGIFSFCYNECACCLYFTDLVCKEVKQLTPKFHRVRIRTGSAPARRRIRSVSILVNVCTSTGCGAAPSWLRNGSGSPEASRGHTQSFYFCQMPDHGAAIQHRADRAG